MNPPTNTLNRDQWFTVLENLANALGEGPEGKLCLIGSAACLFGGINGRTSRDLDIWKPQRLRPTVSFSTRNPISCRTVPTYN